MPCRVHYSYWPHDFCVLNPKTWVSLLIQEFKSKFPVVTSTMTLRGTNKGHIILSVWKFQFIAGGAQCIRDRPTIIWILLQGQSSGKWVLHTQRWHATIEKYKVNHLHLCNYAAMPWLKSWLYAQDSQHDLPKLNYEENSWVESPPW